MVTLSLAKLLLTSLGGVGAMGTFLYWLLRTTLEHRFAEKLEILKSELQSQLQRTSIVYDQQKDTFSHLLSAMNKVIRQIEHGIDGDGGEWEPISAREYKRFMMATSEECLFIDRRTEEAISLFTAIVWDAVQDASFSQLPTSEDVIRAHGQLKLVAKRIAEHFRDRVGLEPESPDPLLDVELLGACRLINTYNFAKFGLPTKTALKFRENESAEEVVSLARKHSKVLRSELTALKQAAESSAESPQVFHALLTTVDRYCASLDSGRL